MKVRIRTPEVRFSLPVPVSMIGFVIRCVPERMFEKMRAETPEPYSSLLNKETIGLILQECTDVLRENKGLEIIHVEAADGTFVSVTL